MTQEKEIKILVYYNQFKDQLFTAIEWYCPVQSSIHMTLNDTETINCVYGTFYQVGWMIQNQHDVYFGVSIDALKHFELLGEL